MEPFVFRDVLADLDAEFRRNYVNENERLTQDPSEGPSSIETRSSIEVEDIDQVDYRKK